MIIKLRARVAYRNGWEAFGEWIAEVQRFILPWIKQVEEQGSSLVQGLIDELEELLNDKVVLLAPLEPPEEPVAAIKQLEALADLGLRFIKHDAERGLLVFDTYVEDEQVESLHWGLERGGEAFVVIRTVDSTAFMILANETNAAWWPPTVLKTGGQLPEEAYEKITTLLSDE